MDRQNYRKVKPFIMALWLIVNDHRNNDIIGWSQAGCSFIILNSHRLFMEVLPSYFNHRCITSFYKQLNQYGFRKVYALDLEYFHRYFQRSEPQLLSAIERRMCLKSLRKTIQEKNMRKSTDAE